MGRACSKNALGWERQMNRRIT